MQYYWWTLFDLAPEWEQRIISYSTDHQHRQYHLPESRHKHPNIFLHCNLLINPPSHLDASWLLMSLFLLLSLCPQYPFAFCFACILSPFSLSFLSATSSRFQLFTFHLSSSPLPPPPPPPPVWSLPSDPFVSSASIRESTMDNCISTWKWVFQDKLLPLLRRYQIWEFAQLWEFSLCLIVCLC